MFLVISVLLSSSVLGCMPVNPNGHSELPSLVCDDCARNLRPDKVVCPDGSACTEVTYDTLGDVRGCIAAICLSGEMLVGPKQGAVPELNCVHGGWKDGHGKVYTSATCSEKCGECGAVPMPDENTCPDERLCTQPLVEEKEGCSVAVCHEGEELVSGGLPLKLLLCRSGKWVNHNGNELKTAGCAGASPKCKKIPLTTEFPSIDGLSTKSALKYTRTPDGYDVVFDCPEPYWMRYKNRENYHYHNLELAAQHRVTLKCEDDGQWWYFSSMGHKFIVEEEICYKANCSTCPPPVLDSFVTSYRNIYSENWCHWNIFISKCPNKKGISVNNGQVEEPVPYARNCVNGRWYATAPNDAVVHCTL